MGGILLLLQFGFAFDSPVVPPDYGVSVFRLCVEHDLDSNSGDLQFQPGTIAVISRLDLFIRVVTVKNRERHPVFGRFAALAARGMLRRYERDSDVLSVETQAGLPSIFIWRGFAVELANRHKQAVQQSQPPHFPRATRIAAYPRNRSECTASLAEAHLPSGGALSPGAISSRHAEP